MEKIIKWQPDVNNSIFRLIYIDGKLTKYEFEKIDPIHEGMTAEEAFNKTRQQCVENNIAFVKIAIETEKDPEEKVRLQENLAESEALLNKLKNWK